MLDYVTRIRKAIGRDLLFLQAVSVLAFDDEGRVLLGRGRSGLWASIGGAVEPGESPPDAAAREFWEETGASVAIERLLGVFGGSAFFTTYPNGDQVAWTSIAFEARIISGEPAPDQIELEELAWFRPDEIDALPMSAASRLVVPAAWSGRVLPVHQPLTWQPPGDVR